jgi:hypothetical protein
VLPFSEEEARVEGARTSLVALLVVAAAVVGALVARPRAESPLGADREAELRAEIARLREDLERETFARQVLEGRLALIERETWPPAAGAPRRPVEDGEAGAASAEPDERAERDAAVAAPGVAAAEAADEERPWFDTGALAETGMSAPEIERLQRVWEAHQLELAYARDEAIRGGYDRRQRRTERFDLQRAFREELGDEGYDRVLYATGQDNRAVVRDVLGQSAASGAGIERGDVIWRYDDQLILHPRELRSATAGGRAGETVPIEVLRDGEILRLFVPRGPLGARVDHERISPTAGD